MEHQFKDPYAVQINIHTLLTSARRAHIATMLLSGKRKQEVINFLIDTFNFEYKQAVSEYRLAYTYIYQTCELEKEEIRKLNLARLEELWDRAEEDELIGKLPTKDYYKTQMKNIDLTNKTSGLYTPTDIQDPDAAKSSDINFNLNIGEKK